MTSNDASIAKFLLIKKAEGFTIKAFMDADHKCYMVGKHVGEPFEEAYVKTLDGDWLKGFTPDDLGGLASDCGGCGGCGKKEPWEKDGDWWKK